MSVFSSLEKFTIKQKLFLRKTISKELGYDGEILFSDHHESHAAV